MKATILTALLLLTQTASAFEVNILPKNPKPGDILNIEVIGIDNPHRAELVFRSKTYPLYAVAPGRMRALIGLTARDKPQLEYLRVVRKRFLLPDQTITLSLEIGKRKYTHQRIRMPKKKAKLPKKTGAKKAIQIIRGALKKDSSKQNWEGVFLRPAKGRRSSKYGHTRTVNGKPWDWHKGIDIAAKDGHPVVAPNGGRIVLTGSYPVQGGTIILDHGQGVMSIFMHLHEFNVESGQDVAKGDRIAAVGGGGFSTGSHLHWGIYIHGAPVNPERLMEHRL